MFVSSSLLAFSGGFLGQTPLPESVPRFELAFPNTVVTQVLEGGKVAAAGPQWKMIVASDKATFVPVLGSRAPHNLPLEFGMPSLRVGGATLTGEAGVPQLSGNTASVDHGSYSSVYDFAPEHVEQSVIVDSLPTRGELTVRFPLTTELGVTDVADGLRFEIPGFGSIHYGDATIIDRLGRRIGALSEVRDGALEIRVPASFIESAAFPIVVDPIINPQLDIDESSSSFKNPDVAWDAVHDLYTVLFERSNSLLESDLFVNRVSSNGAVLAIASVDLTSNHTTEASIANASGNQNYLCVWRKDPDGIFDDIEIRGAIVTTGGGASSFFTISTFSDNESHPDVGGSGANFLVVWQEDPAVGGGGQNIVARTVNSGSKALGPKVDIANSSLDEIRPSISHHTVDGQWAVAYEVVNSSADSDIRAALFNVGTLLTTNFSVATGTTLDDHTPDVAQMANGDFVFAWQRSTIDPVFGGIGGIDSDIFTRRLGANSVSFQASTSAVNLTSLESTSENLDQVNIRVCANLTRVLYAYVDGNNARLTCADYDGSTPVLIEKQIELNQVPAGQAGHVNLATRGHITNGFDQILAVFGDGNDVLGQFFQSTTAGGVTVVQTGCGGAAEPKLTLTANDNDPLICEPFTISLSNFAQALMVIGTPASIPLCPGQGGCSLGATPTIIVPIANGVFTFALPCDPAILGVQVALTGVSIIPATSTTTACGPPKFGQFLRTSDTLVIDFQ